MKYQFLLVTHEGPTLLTYDDFSAWIGLFIEDGEIDGITELLDEVPFDYETLKHHQASVMSVGDIKINLKTGGWRY